MVDNGIGGASSQIAVRRKSEGDLDKRGIKYSYKNRIQKSKSVAIISSTTLPKAALNEMCPSTFIQTVLTHSFENDNDDSVITKPLHQSEFIQPTSQQIEAYGHSTDAVIAVRACDVEALRELLANGKQLEVCNKFGESLLHMACRRSNAHVVSFLLNEANVSPRIKDDYGRTPLHDACWRGNPEYEIVELLLQAEPRLAFVQDVRGHQPFQYARREHWDAWKEFLDNKKDLF
jgi:ankyrin repeat protein